MLLENRSGYAMKLKSLIFLFAVSISSLASCNSTRPAINETGSSANENQESENGTNEDEIEMKLKLEIKDYEFVVSLEENDAAHELVEMTRNEPITINFEDYGGFEKVGPLGRSLTADNTRITTKPGDIVLYQGNQIVMFYGSNTWSYTMLGHVEDLTYWEEALGNGDVVVTFTLLEDE